MHILTFLFFLLNLSSNFPDPFFLLVKMLSEPEKTNKRVDLFSSIYHKTDKQPTSLICFALQYFV